MAGEGAMLRGMLVEIGFGVDKPSQQKAVQAHSATQKQITKDDKKGSADRLKSEVDEWNKRRELQKKELKRAADARDEYFRKWRVGLVGTAEVAAKTAASIAAVSTGIVFAVDRAAKSLERLNYLSGRAKSSPSKLTAFGYAASQTGSSQEEGDAFMEQFGQRLNYPGYRQALQNQIGNIYGPNGKLLDSATLATRLGQRLARVRQSQGVLRAQAQGSVFGLEGTSPLFNSVTSGPFVGYESSREAQQAAIGSDPNAAAENATKFEQSMRRLQSVIEDIATKIETKLTQTIGPQLDQFAAILTKNSGLITNTITELADGVTKITAAFAGSDALAGTLKGMGDSFKSLEDTLGSEDFKQDIRDFVDNLKAMAGSFKTFLQKLHILPADSAGGDDGVDPLRKMLGGSGGGRSAGPGYSGPHSRGSAQQSANADAFKDELRKAGLPDEGIAAAMGSAQTESGFNPRAHNDVTGGHTGAIQWDATRWGKVKRWIESQGGDPFDVRWQARAFVAEGRAQPGEPLYDGEKTRRGFKKLEMSKGDLGLAVEGVGDIERFGPGEEGGRAANARAWLPRVRAPAAPVGPAVARMKGRPPLPSGAMYWVKDSQGNDVAVDAQGRAVDSGGKPTTVASPFGGLDRGAFSVPPPGQTVTNSSADNSRGDTTINANQTFNITGGDPAAGLSAAKLSAGRGQQDLLRRMQGAVQ